MNIEMSEEEKILFSEKKRNIDTQQNGIQEYEGDNERGILYGATKFVDLLLNMLLIIFVPFIIYHSFVAISDKNIPMILSLALYLFVYAKIYKFFSE